MEAREGAALVAGTPDAVPSAQEDTMHTISRSLAWLSLAALSLAACAPSPPPAAPSPPPPTPPRREAWGGADQALPPAVSLAGDDRQASPSPPLDPQGSQVPNPTGVAPQPPGPPATVVQGGEDPITVEGSAPAFRVDALVRSHRPELYKCARLGGGDVRGKVTVSVDFDAGGTVRRVWIKSSTLGSPAVEGCIAQGPVRWHLDGAQGRAVVTFTMTFDGRK